ncbi:sensor histidine kinase [Tepidibacter aestuarii]|uniref:sensor histidine kinase n=1 Tax=Tepidibacter aestuarii TaxID=2925782 RepID=UPI0020BDD53F|nr:HAMP domain-containing sensor histidine kinase [Tepidibacter aestuarii]CAH2211921.1 Histidine kinase [Tepidibacter aestuarii]
MKLWQKIYILFFIAFLLTFNIAGITIIEKIHNETLNREVQRGLSEQKSISYILNMNFSEYNLQINNNDINDFVNQVTNKYLKDFNEEEIYIEILDMNNNTFFTNLNFNLPSKRDELNGLVLNERKYIIRNIDNKYYLFVAGAMNIGNRSFKLSYSRNISHIYEERKNQYKFFFKFEANICLIFAAIMYSISKFITKPINDLTRSTKSIAKGNYHERVETISKDELGILSNNFNIMANAIEEKINELERNNNEKQRFIDNLTHEIKTPLTSIIGYANLLKTTKVSEEIFFESVDFIYKEGKRLEQLSFKMMDLILLKVDDFDLKYEKIMNILYDVRGSLRPKLNKRGIDLIIEGKDCELLIEKDLMKILLSNLVDNAIKASEKNSNIYLSVYKNEDKTIIEVKDNGVGMDKEHLDKVMEPFYMVDKSRTRKNNGAGLGLSICKKIADIHNSNIEIESKLGKGTIIKIIFR